jgi:hypothetical protein
MVCAIGIRVMSRRRRVGIVGIAHRRGRGVLERTLVIHELAWSAKCVWLSAVLTRPVDAHAYVRMFADRAAGSP